MSWRGRVLRAARFVLQHEDFFDVMISTSLAFTAMLFALIFGRLQSRYWWTWARGNKRTYVLNLSCIMFLQLAFQRRLGIPMTRRAGMLTIVFWVFNLASLMRSSRVDERESADSGNDTAKMDSSSESGEPLPSGINSSSTQALVGTDDSISSSHESRSRRVRSLPSRLNIPKDSGDKDFVISNEFSSSLEEKILEGNLSDESVARGLLALCFFRKNAGRSLFEAVVASVSSPESRSYSPGEIVFRERDKMTDLIIVHRGSLGLVEHASLSDPQASVVHDLSSLNCLGVLTLGDSFGDLEIVLPSLGRAITCVALTHASVWIIPLSIFTDIWANRPDVLFSYIQGCLGHLWRISSVVLNDFFHIHSAHKTDTPHLQPEHVTDLCLPLGLVQSAHLASTSETTLKSLLPAEVLFAQGDPTSHVYVVREGSVLGVDRGGNTTTIYNTGDILGGIAFLANVPHSFKAVAGPQGAAIIALAKPDILRLCSKRPECVSQLLQQSASEMCSTMHLFSFLGLQRVWCRAAQSLFERGQAVSHLYIVTCGRVRILHDDMQHHSHFPAAHAWTQATPLNRRNSRDDMLDNDAWTVAKSISVDPDKPTEVGRGGTVGDVSMFLGHTTHENSAICVRETEVVRISKAVFERICKLYPAAMLKFSRVMGRQLCTAAIHSTQLLNKVNLCTFCLFPVPGTSDEDMSRFATALRDALSAFGLTKLIDRATVNEVLRSADEGSHRPSAPMGYVALEDFVELARLRAWLSQQEDFHTFLVLHADAHVSPWTRVCVDNADLILMVCSPTSIPDVGPIEQCMLWSNSAAGNTSRWRWRVEKELVMLHKQKSTTPLPRGTREWLTRRPEIHRHHHIRRDISADYGRLARHLTGHSVGLVLGGGGSRGLAHLGVIRALQDANIPIDYIGGTSQGAIIGASYASCLSVRGTEERAAMQSLLLGNFRNLFRDFTLPVLTVFNGQKFSWLVRHTLGRDTQIEDLWLGFFCVCTNVTTAEATLCERGNLWESVRASMTIVGLVPPMYTREGLLVDGGYVDNLPAEHMRTIIGSGLCIAADVEDKDNSAFEDVTQYQDGVVSGAKVMLSRVMHAVCAAPCTWLHMRNPFDVHLPSHAQMVDNLMFLTHQVQFRRAIKCVDHYLRPPIHKYSLLDYDMIDDISRLGYTYTRTEIKQWCDQAKRHVENKLKRRRTGQGTSNAMPLSPFLFGGNKQRNLDQNLPSDPSTAAVLLLLNFRDDARHLNDTDSYAPTTTASASSSATPATAHSN